VVVDVGVVPSQKGVEYDEIDSYSERLDGPLALIDFT